MGAVVIETSLFGKADEDTLWTHIDSLSERDSIEKKEDAIGWEMERLVGDGEAAGAHEDDLYEMAKDRVDMDYDWAMYPGDWTHYMGGDFELFHVPDEGSPEDLLLKLEGKNREDDWDTSSKWDNKVFYWYDMKADRTIVRAVVPC